MTTAFFSCIIIEKNSEVYFVKICFYDCDDDINETHIVCSKDFSVFDAFYSYCDLSDFFLRRCITLMDDPDFKFILCNIDDVEVFVNIYFPYLCLPRYSVEQDSFDDFVIISNNSSSSSVVPFLSCHFSDIHISKIACDFLDSFFPYLYNALWDYVKNFVELREKAF